MCARGRAVGRAQQREGEGAKRGATRAWNDVTLPRLSWRMPLIEPNTDMIT